MKISHEVTTWEKRRRRSEACEYLYMFLNYLVKSVHDVIRLKRFSNVMGATGIWRWVVALPESCNVLVNAEQITTPRVSILHLLRSQAYPERLVPSDSSRKVCFH